MPTPRRQKSRPAAKPAPDAKLLLPKLRSCLDRERAVLGRWHQRLLRSFHAYEKQGRLVARLQRRLAKLEAG